MAGSELQIFNYQETEVRTVLKDGEPWFVAKDVAEILGYKWNGSARVHHIPEEWRGVTSVVTPTGKQDLIIISEPGLFFFLNRSDKAKALPMQKWIAGEVLPSIRRTGKYEVVPQHKIPSTFSEALQLAADQAKQLEAQKPLVEFAQNVNASSNSMDLGSFAKILGTGRNRLFQWLRDNNYLMANGKPYQRYVDNEYFVVIETTFNRGEEICTYAKPQITGKGQIAIERIFNQKKAA